MSGENDKTRILICRTCPRYDPNPRGLTTAGTELGQAVRQALLLADTLELLEVRAVNCLAGCKNPCNVALDADGKTRLRFSRIQPEHIDAIVAAARTHSLSRDGDLPDRELAKDLRARLTARSPPRIGG
jgi:predicted metal-binding protein